MTPETIKKSDWHYWGEWQSAPLSGAIWVDWHLTEPAKAISKVPLHTFLSLNGHLWINASDYKTVTDTVEKLFKESSFKEYSTFFHDLSLKLEHDHLEDLEKNNDKDFLHHLFLTYRNVATVWVWASFAGDELGRVMTKKRIVLSDEELLTRLQPYYRTTWLEKQNQDIKNLAKYAVNEGIKYELTKDVLKNHTDLEKKIIEHVKEYEWFGTHHWMGESYTMEKCIIDINAELKKTAPASGNKSETKEESEKNKDIFRLLAVLIYWRTHGAEVTAKVVYASRERLKKISASFGLTYDELLFMTAKEIEAMYSDRNRLAATIEKIQERRKGYGCFNENNTEVIVTGEVLQRFLKVMLEKSELSLSEFAGSVASKGKKVSGIAKIILHPNDFTKFKKGDILICSETSPDFVPLMKDAIAIVTEVGGITSHAAIVSRELGIPCIIGTKIATQVLKDGDMVEVDAEKGIVTILTT